MLRRRLHLFLLLTMLLPSIAAAQRSIDLRGLAAFRTGDDVVWRSKYIDEEKDWVFIPVPGAWEDHGFPQYDGYGWYRMRFRLPAEMRSDSLLLVMSGVSDADETFLNGEFIGFTGGFPPDFRSEPYSLRVYPLPKSAREEYNLLAVRVFDSGDRGGLTGSILRIIPVDSLYSVLDAIVDEPFHSPPLFVSNGVMVSAISQDSASVQWTRNRPYDAIAPELHAENVLTRMQITVETGNGFQPLSELHCDSIGYLHGSGVVFARYGDIEVFWYHPLQTRRRILVATVRQPESHAQKTGLIFTFERSYWKFEEFDEERDGYALTSYVFAYNSCCDELVSRDLEEFLAEGSDEDPAYGLERELRHWSEVLSHATYLPTSLHDDEKIVYRRSLAALLQARVREEGLGAGQILSAFTPLSRAVTIPAEHLQSCRALAAAGMRDEALDGLAFIEHAQHDAFVFHDVFGTPYGVGYPYLVTPSRYYGSGDEYQWAKPDQALLRYDGMPAYIEAVEALRSLERRTALLAGEAFSDSTFLSRYWPVLSSQVADVLMYRSEAHGLLEQDDSPWGDGLSKLPGVYSSVHAAYALTIAAEMAAASGNGLKSFLYTEAASRIKDTLTALLQMVMRRNDATGLSPMEKRAFHPLMCDAVTLGLLPPGSAEADFLLQMIDAAFRIEGSATQYSARPDGDWYDRQARPQIALRLARAHAVAGNLARAEELFASVTREAMKAGGLLPELVDPVTGNWYGAVPAMGTGAAEYILTAEAITLQRLAD